MDTAYENAVIEFLVTQSQVRAKIKSATSPPVCAEDVAIFDELDSLGGDEFARIYTIYLLGADVTCEPVRAKRLALVAGFAPLENVASDGDLHLKLALGKERWLSNERG